MGITPSVDLFASRINKQLDCYVSFRPDPEAFAVDAFSFPRRGFEFYAFSPFSLIPKVLQKAQQDNSSGVLIVPLWRAQVWWPVLKKMAKREPVTLGGVDTLTLPSHPEKQHPL